MGFDIEVDLTVLQIRSMFRNLRVHKLAPGVDPQTHPRDLSEGQRLALALAVVLAADAPLLLLDEPTRGLDYPTKHRLVALLRRRAASGPWIRMT